MNRSELGLIAWCLFFTFFARETHAAPFYQENFNFDSTLPSNTFDALTQTGWSASRANSRIGVIGFLKVAPGISRHSSAFNSRPLGPDDGYPLWTKEVTGLTVFTEEYPFNIASLIRVRYLQRLDGVSGTPSTGEVRDGTRLALRIKALNGVERWYLGDLVNPQLRESEWESVDVDVASSTFRLAKVRADVGPSLPSKGGAALPEIGVVTAFGVFVDQVRGRVRIDNFTLIDPFSANGVAPEAVPTRVGTPVARPTDSDPDTDPDLPGFSATATPTPNGPAINPGPTYSFCPVPGKKRKKAVVGRGLWKSIVSTIDTRTPLGRRNKLVVELLISKGIHADSLENVRVSDLLTLAGRSFLTVYGSERRPVPISEKLGGSISAYLRTAELTDPSSPLFPTFSDAQKKTTTAACGDELFKVLLSAFRKAGVSRRVSFQR